jgi:hypothetical protein
MQHLSIPRRAQAIAESSYCATHLMFFLAILIWCIIVQAEDVLHAGFAGKGAQECITEYPAVMISWVHN